MIGLRDSYNEKKDAAATLALKLRQLPDLVKEIFAPKGHLQKQMGLEHRPQQAEMAFHIAQSLVTNSSLLFEAGTGVGKSLAYLIPSLILSKITQRPAIVASNTIALQEQIEKKDIPQCRELFERTTALQDFSDFKTAFLVGKHNYLCGTRLRQAIKTKAELFPSSEQEELRRIADWADQTQTGLQQELSPAPDPTIWEWVNAESHACNSRNCNAETCFYQRAKAAIQGANLVIVNHSLLFALLGAGFHPQNDKRGILFADDFVIFDEAHTVPQQAANYFGIRLSSYGIKRIFYRLYNFNRKTGLLRKWGNHYDILSLKHCLQAFEDFFEYIDRELLKHQSIIRVYKPNAVEAHFLAPTKELLERLGDVLNRLNPGPAHDEIKGIRGQLSSMQADLLSFLEMAERDTVYWIERTGKHQNIIHLRSVPLSVARHLRERVFERKTSAILTSATLDDGRGLERFLEKVGAQDQESAQLESPFDYASHMQVFIASDAPMPHPQNARLAHKWLAACMAKCIESVQGGSLVLWTSYQDMLTVADLMQAPLQAIGRKLYVQSRDGSRNELRNAFSADGHAVLFGTDSFWNGVDIKGPALSQVIIPRLPFENPSHPLAEAKAEWITAQNKNPFIELTLPEAIIKFRQGIGRLIRSMDDQGCITLLDSRILTKPYGRQFLSVIPTQNIQQFNQKNQDLIFQNLSY